MDVTTPYRDFTVDFEPATLSIFNPTKYTIYVRMGGEGASKIGFTDIIPPNSSFTGDPVGAQSFSVFIDLAGDPSPSFPFPVTVTFSTGASSVNAPLSLIASTGMIYGEFEADLVGAAVTATGVPLNFFPLVVGARGGLTNIGGGMRIDNAGDYQITLSCNIFSVTPLGCMLAILANWTGATLQLTEADLNTANTFGASGGTTRIMSILASTLIQANFFSSPNTTISARVFLSVHSLNL